MIDDIDDEEWGPQARALFIAVREALGNPGMELRTYSEEKRYKDRIAKARQRARERGENTPRICIAKGCGTEFPYQIGVRYCETHRGLRCTTNYNTSHP